MTQPRIWETGRQRFLTPRSNNPRQLLQHAPVVETFLLGFKQRLAWVAVFVCSCVRENAADFSPAFGAREADEVIDLVRFGFDEEIRFPGWIALEAEALGDLVAFGADRRSALETCACPQFVTCSSGRKSAQTFVAPPLYSQNEPTHVGCYQGKSPGTCSGASCKSARVPCAARLCLGLPCREN